jgi:hypothetical protein
VAEAKILIFVAVFVLFLIVVKNLFSGKTTYDPAGMPSSGNAGQFDSDFDGSRVTTADADQKDEGRAPPSLIGSDLPFPISLPPRQADLDGKFNRPMVLNYYFKKLDLVRGPDDPSSFCDEFFIQFEEPETQAVWTNEYIVATPAGLQHLLDSEGHDSLHFDGMLIVVPKWNVPDLLKVIMDEVMETHPSAQPPKENSKKKDAERYWT